jgi:small subunit ribosomal protein S3
MGQKVHPIGLRVGIIEDWRSKWFSQKNYAKWLHEDLRIRAFVKEKLKATGISRVEIERAAEKVKVSVHTAKPGIIIGKKGAGVDDLRREIQTLTASQVLLNIVEVRKAELDAQLVAESIAQQLERRVAFRRAMKKAVTTTMRFGAKGVRINCAGRLGGAEIARREWYLEGRVPLHTLRANIDYGFAEAHTTYGIIGVKVWICKGEVLDKRAKVG